MTTAQREKSIYWREPNWIKAVTKKLQLKQLIATEQLVLENEVYSDAAFKKSNKEYYLATAVIFSKLEMY